MGLAISAQDVQPQECPFAEMTDKLIPTHAKLIAIRSLLYTLASASPNAIAVRRKISSVVPMDWPIKIIANWSVKDLDREFQWDWPIKENVEDLAIAQLFLIQFVEPTDRDIIALVTPTAPMFRLITIQTVLSSQTDYLINKFVFNQIN